MATAATMIADLPIRERQRAWKDPQSYAEKYQRSQSAIKSPCWAAWRNPATSRKIREWLTDGVGLQLTLIVRYHGQDRFAVFKREWRMFKGQRMMVAVDPVSGDVFGGVPHE